MAVNVPVNSGGLFVSASQSVTGSFGGLLVLAGGQSASITGLKYVNGYNVSNPGFNPTYSLAEGSITPSSLLPLGIANGTKLELLITSCSLGAGSSPVFLYN
jgi:hypothetical protein